MNESPTELQPPGSSQRAVLFWVVIAVGTVVVGSLLALGIWLLYFTGQRSVRIIPLTNQPSATVSGVVVSEAEKTKLALPVAPVDYSKSNVVSVSLGAESAANGIKHLFKQPDGRTTVETLESVACRFLNRTNKTFGYLYFKIDDAFKRDALKAARIEMEFRVPGPAVMRLQYDALVGETHNKYKSVVPEGMATVELAPNAQFIRLGPSNDWQTVAVEVNDGAFANSQNGGADFRVEITPPQIYIRRVTVTRRNVP